MMYTDFRELMLYHIEQQLRRRIFVVDNLNDKLNTIMPIKVFHPASQWAGMDQFGTNMVRTLSAWINVHTTSEVYDPNFFQECLFWAFRNTFWDDGNICLECCRDIDSTEMCCLNFSHACKVNYLDAYMFKRATNLGRFFGRIELRASEQIMRCRKLTAKHDFSPAVEDVMPIGQYYSDYSHILSEHEFEIFHDLKT